MLDRDQEFEVPERLISLERAEELPHWAQLLQCPEGALRESVRAVEQVERELREYTPRK